MRDEPADIGDVLAGHGGCHAVTVARNHGITRIYTLSGGHVFPLYDAAIHADPPLRLIDVRHEATAVFAAEATAKLSRVPGLAVLTAGPGVTNGVSAVATAHFNGSPLLVLAGRAPSGRWGTGSLQELDHPPLLAPVTKRAGTVHAVEALASEVDAALRLARTPHRGPVFLDVPIEQLYATATVSRPSAPSVTPVQPDPEALAAAAAVLRLASRPVLVLGSDVWTGGAEQAARRLAETLSLPVITTGMSRGVLPGGHELLVTRARATALATADLVVVAGAPLDFRLGFGAFGGSGGGPPAQVVHLADASAALARHVPLAGSAVGDLATVLDGLLAAVTRTGGAPPKWAKWLATLRAATAAAKAADAAPLTSPATPIHPARLYGELRRVLDDNAVVIGDGGDFVSFAGRYLEPARAGNWLDPGPYGCLGTGLGYAIAARLERPASQVVLLLGDGAAGFSLMDVDTLVRHRLPVVIVCGNNGSWALERQLMRALYGYDVAAELAWQTRYDQVAGALGGAGELVTDPSLVAPALRRGFASGVPYLINVITDPTVAYPRSTTGI